ncbi:hypothetical protein Tco_1552079 [Tanacetum coccineum]
MVAAFQAPPSLDYVSGPEEPEQAPPSPEFVPKPVYPEFIPLEDEVFPTEEQPLPATVSSTTNLPGYIADFDPDKDEEDPKEDPTDYPADGGDDDDDESFDDDDEDDDDDVEEDEEEEEEHLAPADSVPPHVARLLAIPTPPPSPLSPLSSPLPQILSPLPEILSPPLPVSPPPLHASPTYPLGYRAAMIRLRAETPSTSHRSRCFRGYIAALEEVVYCSRITDTWDEMVEDMLGIPTVTDVAGLSQRMKDFVTTVRHDTYEIYVRLDDAQDERLLMSGQFNMLHRAHSEVRALRTIVLAQQTEIAGLRAADRTRQAQLMETLTLLRTLQTQVTELQS